MYANEQILPIFNLLDDLNNSASEDGCDESLTVVGRHELNALTKEIKRLQSLEQQFVIGVHNHREGSTTYPLLVQNGVEVDEVRLAKIVGDTLDETDERESLGIEVIQEPTIIAA